MLVLPKWRALDAEPAAAPLRNGYDTHQSHFEALADFTASMLGNAYKTIHMQPRPVMTSKHGGFELATQHMDAMRTVVVTVNEPLFPQLMRLTANIVSHAPRHQLVRLAHALALTE